MAAGVFVVFEGGEGAGKSTQAALLVSRLRAMGQQVVATREPGGTQLAEDIRALLLRASAEPMSGRCEALLFAAARADHVERVIRPALAAGQVVVCDRFVDSSVAYQGDARGLPRVEIADLSEWATDSLMPDLTVLLDVSPAAGVARAQDRNRMESESLEFHLAVRAGLLRSAEEAPHRYLVLDAAGAVEDLARKVAARVEELLADRP
ncbi:MAG: dTMP kinase [Actinomycetota bacterium]|nr:dTMP kinase [Actinomycetota bacterium]